MENINIKYLILCMIGIDKDDLNGELGGMTRLQKLLYLLEVEEGVRASDDIGFEFKPYKAGPYSAKLYDSLEFLENFGFINSEVVGDSTNEEAVEVDALKFEYLLNPEEQEKNRSDAYVEKRFKLTIKGKEKVENLLNSQEYKPYVNKIREIKSRFGNYSLQDLLYYIYKKYPEMTTESEIRDRILKRGR